MSLTLRKLRIGKIDGKHEYLTPANERERSIFDAFLIPESVEPERMHNGDTYFIEGFRGTGKTSLLRWHAEQQRLKGSFTDFVLFKSDLTESQRLQISTEVGISWADVESKSMEISQDFKSAWIWFILHKIGEQLTTNKNIYKENSSDVTSKATRLLGLEDDSVFKKIMGFMPKLEGAQVKVRSDIGFFEAELGGDFKRDGDSGKTTLDALGKKITSLICSIEFRKSLFLYFDELEVFYHSVEQHRRDQRMVRDLLFSVAKMNDVFRGAKVPVHVLAAVRSEVVDAMGSLGQEVDRIVHDRGFHISWHHANKSLNHPLIQIIKRKINASEKAEGINASHDPIFQYFPRSVNGQTVEAFILDKSFYKPRDIVWRLSIAQKLFPNETSFTENVLYETEMEYSSKLWDEIRYELSAMYSDNEVDAIESVLSGGAAAFDISEMESRFYRSAKHSQTLQKILDRRSVREILADLYRLGAIGNSFRAGSTGTDIRNRWAFRGDPTLLAEKRMVIHTALLKRLSAVAVRKRGSRSGRTNREKTIKS